MPDDYNDDIIETTEVEEIDMDVEDSSFDSPELENSEPTEEAVEELPLEEGLEEISNEEDLSNTENINDIKQVENYSLDDISETDNYQDLEDRDLELLPDTETDLLENNSQFNNDHKFQSVSDYYGAHNYGPDDYDTYSQDPVWRRIMLENDPNVELPPLNNDAQFQSMADFYGAHNYGPDDFNTYIRDPEWQRLNNKENLDADFIEGGLTWLKDINPNYAPHDLESPYNVNCGSCTYSVWNRLNGDAQMVASDKNIPYNYQMEQLTGMKQVSMSPSQIEANLLAQGPGSHAIIGIDRKEGDGHWFNAINHNGNVYAVDGQNGKIHTWPPDYGDVINWEMSVRR